MAARSRAGRTGLGFLLLGVLLAGVVLVVDRAVVHVVNGRVGAQLQGELGTTTPPAVDIEGFPFLTQVLRGSLRSVHIVADDIPAPDPRSTGLAHVDLRLQGVTSPDRYRTFTAHRVDGAATLDYPSARRLIGHPVSYRPDGLVQLDVSTTLVSVPVAATVVGRPSVDVSDQTLSLTDARVTVAGVEVPAATSQALLDSVLKPVPISGIPYDLSVQSLTATPDGLVAVVTGSDVSFKR